MPRETKISLLSSRISESLVYLTGIAAISISIISFCGGLNLNSENLIQISVAAIGILMAYFVIQSEKQNIEINNLKNRIEQSIQGEFEIVKFNNDGDAFKHMAQAMNSAEKDVRHASLYDVTRKNTSISFFEKAYERIILDNDINVTYIGDLSDSYRKKRVVEFKSRPEVQKYFVRYIDSKNLLSPDINFMTIDEKELILAIPGVSNRNTVISVKNIEIVLAFDRYFELIWSISQDYSIENKENKTEY